MMISLLPAQALAEAPEEEPAPVEEPAPAEEATPAEETEALPAEEPASGDEPEELRKPYSLSGAVLTFKANGTLDTSNVGGAIQVSSANIESFPLSVFL